jgi:hypothetical protein
MKFIVPVLLLIIASCSSSPQVVAEAEASTITCQTCESTTPAQPVILVHGRNDAPSRWNTLVTNWSARGYTENVNLFRIDLSAYCTSNTFCAMLPAPDGTGATYVNESYANCLKRYIDEKVPCATDGDGGISCPSVDIVTHSQGGVVARYYARFLASPREVNDMSNMSGPLNGIKNCGLAGACLGVNPEDCPDSAFMHKLNGVSPEGDGTNDETPGATALGPVHYDTVVSTGDSVISPWCTAYYMMNPQTQQGDDYNCKSPNYTLDADADSCKLSNVQHLVIPSNTTAINHVYCQINKE